MSVLSAIILGLVQGITEFLPISSSGHLSILQNLFGMKTAEDGHMFFDVLLHLGTLISVCIVYRKDVGAMLKEAGLLITGPKRRQAVTRENMINRRLMLMIAVATVPLLLVLPVKSKIEQLYYTTGFIGAALMLNGCVLYVSDRIQPGKRNEKSITASNALVIGLCQAVAVIPGLSRSGTTITAGLSTGQSREFAVKFSFLISLPAVLGANILGLIDAIKEGIDVSLLPAYIIGTAVSAVVGVGAISLVKGLVRKGGFGKIAYYCWAVGIITLIASAFI